MWGRVIRVPVRQRTPPRKWVPYLVMRTPHADVCNAQPRGIGTLCAFLSLQIVLRLVVKVSGRLRFGISAERIELTTRWLGRTRRPMSPLKRMETRVSEAAGFTAEAAPLNVLRLPDRSLPSCYSPRVLTRLWPPAMLTVTGLLKMLTSQFALARDLDCHVGLHELSGRSPSSDRFARGFDGHGVACCLLACSTNAVSARGMCAADGVRHVGAFPCPSLCRELWNSVAMPAGTATVLLMVGVAVYHRRQTEVEQEQRVRRIQMERPRRKLDEGGTRDSSRTSS